MSEDNNEVDVQAQDCSVDKEGLPRRKTSPVALFSLLALCVTGGVLLWKNIAVDIRTQINSYLYEPIDIANKIVVFDTEYPEEIQVAEDIIVSKKTVEVPITYKPNQWIVDRGASMLSFEATQYGQTFNGSFDFDGEIIFDPEDIENASAFIEIDINSIATGSLNRDEQARMEDWFYVESYPIATYKSMAFTKGEEEGAYVSHGVLDLRGVVLAIELPFTLTFLDEEIKEEVADEVVIESGGVADSEQNNKEFMAGEITEDITGESQDVVQKKMAKNKVEMIANISINRTDFGVGQGKWKKEDVVSDNVDIFVLLHASRPKSIQPQGF